MMTIILKKDWDVPIQPPIYEKPPEGYFAGRDKEVAVLANEILRRKSGALLVSGYRGVGKTTLVYKALSEVKAKAKDKIIMVLLNAAQLEAESEGTEKIDPRKIIENLIRRLYSTTHDLKNFNKDVQEKIDTLYRKAVATEFKLVEVYRQQQELSLESIKEEDIEFMFTEKNLRNVVFIISWTIAVALQYANILPWGWVNKLLPLLFAFPVPYTVNLLYKKHLRVRKFEEVKNKAEELYQFDNSIGNLEFDLEEIHRDIIHRKKKLVYVIDELDKLKINQIKEVLKFFKNLFTLSDALFIFVGGEEMYNLAALDKKTETYRPKEYTYFTSKYFLARPAWKDLSKFLDSVIERKHPLDESKFEILKRSLSFEAKNDFFDLKTYIKDRIIDFNKVNQPIIELKDLEEDIKKARFHKAITILFEERYKAFSYSKWIENERLLRKLFEHAHTIYSSYSGGQFSDPTADSLVDSIIRDFNGLMYRIKVFNVQNEAAQNIRGLQVPIRTYQYTGNIQIEPPTQLNEPTEIEKRFINEFRTYCKYIIALNNAFRTVKKDVVVTEQDFWDSPNQFVMQINNWGFDALNQYNSHYPMYQKIVNQIPPYPYKREEIEKSITRIVSHTKTMLTNLPTFTYKILFSQLPHLQLQIQSFTQNANLFSGSANQIRSALNPFNPLVVHKPDFSRQILLIINRIDAIVGVKQQIKDNAQTHRVVSILEKRDKFKINGFHSIITESSELLRDSIVEFLNKTESFFASKD